MLASIKFSYQKRIRNGELFLLQTYLLDFQQPGVLLLMGICQEHISIPQQIITQIKLLFARRSRPPCKNQYVTEVIVCAQLHHQ